MAQPQVTTHLRRDSNNNHRHQTLTLDFDSLFMLNDDVSDSDSLIANMSNASDLFDDHENKDNFTMDLFHQRALQSQVLMDSLNNDNDNDNGIPVSGFEHDLINNSCLAILDENSDMGAVENLELDCGLTFGFDANETHHICGFAIEHIGDGDYEGADGDHHPENYYEVDDDFVVERRESRVSRDQIIVDFGSDLDLEDNETSLAVDLNAFPLNNLNENNQDNDIDDDIISRSIPLCLDALEFEDDIGDAGFPVLWGSRRVEEDNDIAAENFGIIWDSLNLNDDDREHMDGFEWEEVHSDGDDQRESSNMQMNGDEDENSISYSIRSEIAVENTNHINMDGELGNLEWQVLFNTDANEDYTYTAENDILFGQFAEIDAAIAGPPPAAKVVIQNLLEVTMIQKDVDNNDTICAICKDDINVGEKAKQLPCAHRYHGECIVPWLGIRNTCPVCRYELPTDDADYERRKGRNGNLF